jgi:hypothetical protein
VLVSLFAISIYWRSTTIGFLLDDFLPPANVYAALHGNVQPLLNMAFFGWAADVDGLYCFRPGTALSFIVDYLIWNNNPFGYHLSNILFLVGNCWVVGLLTYELARLFGLRYRTYSGVAAALLFAAYPLHVETTAWVIGRMDSLCTLFYVGSIYAYVRFVIDGGRKTLIAALVSFVAALTCKEMAVTLPLVLTVFVALLSATQQQKRTLWKTIAAFWAALIGFAVIRSLMLGTIIGGYGETLDKRAIRRIFKNFFDGGTWWKVIVGANEEYKIDPVWNWFGFVGCLITGTAAAISIFVHRPMAKLFAFLAAWFFIAVLPTFQIFHIFPNLVGARLFFLSSAPLCMAVAFSFTGLFERTKTPRQFWAFGSAMILAMAAGWTTLLAFDMQPWLKAHQIMSLALDSARKAAERTKPGGTRLFLNLPADYKGAGLIARPEYLAYMLKPPITQPDLSANVEACERPLPGPNEFIAAQRLKRKIKYASRVVIWNKDVIAFLPWMGASGATKLDVGALPDADAKSMRQITAEKLNPLEVQAVQITFREMAEYVGRMVLVWHAPGYEWWQCMCPPGLATGHTLTFVPSRLKSWTFAPTIENLAVEGAAQAHITAVRSIPVSTIEPKLFCNATTAHVDGSAIANCRKIRLYLSKPGESFSDMATGSPPENNFVEHTFELAKPLGDIKLTDGYAPSKGLHAVCAQAYNDKGSPIGILSEFAAVRF